MSTERVLITGATGFLGRALVRTCLDRGLDVLGTGHGESKIVEFRQEFPGVQCEFADVSRRSDVDRLFEQTVEPITHVIHSAALKHVGLCEDNPGRAVNTNVVGSLNVAEAASRWGVDEAILISTDKAVNPSCVYGNSKWLAEQVFLSHGYGVFRGVNFFRSTGSVLDIWDRQMREGKPIRLNDPEAIRYFVDPVCVADTVVSFLDAKSVFSVDKCYKVQLGDLALAFTRAYDYHQLDAASLLAVEKQIEELPCEGVEVIDASIEYLVEWLKR